MKYYLYGLQRSGTNILENFLEKNYEIVFSNEKNDRKHHKHKHFRIYNNKELIPNTDVNKQYHNDIIINSIDELDKILGDTKHQNKYIIVYKDIFSWLLSIETWAKMCNWKSNKKVDFIDDYFNYIEKWLSIKNERVLLINYREYIEFLITIKNQQEFKNNNLIRKINTFLDIKYNQNKIIDIITKVTCSSTFTTERLNYYYNKEYMKEYSETEIHNIKNSSYYENLKDKIIIE